MTEELSEFTSFFGCRHALPMGSGTVALYAALCALGSRGKRILLPALACPNLIVAVTAAGGVPVLVDVSPDDGNISVPAVVGAMDDTVAAVVAVDTFGYPADTAQLRAAATPFACVVIEDACQAYGGRVDGKALGGRADVGVVSFGYGKPLELMGGGLLLTNEAAIRDKVLRMTESWSHRSRRRHAVALRLALQNRTRTLRYLATHLNLLHYGCPRSSAELTAAWQAFATSLERVAANLTQARRLIDRLPGIQTLAYGGDGWLPWRYSFLIPDREVRERFGRLAQGVNLGLSRLYPPLSQFPELRRQVEDMPVANRLSSAIVNLRYEMTCEGTQALLDNLSRLCDRWEI